MARYVRRCFGTMKPPGVSGVGIALPVALSGRSPRSWSTFETGLPEWQGGADVRKALVLLLLVVAIVPGPAAAMQGEGFNSYFSPMDPGQETGVVESDGPGWPPSPSWRRPSRRGSSPTTSKRLWQPMSTVSERRAKMVRWGSLFSGGPVTRDGILAETQAIEPDPGNECGWQDIIDVGDAIQDGEAYFNVHTTAYPDGDIRSRSRPSSRSCRALRICRAGTAPWGRRSWLIAAADITLGCNPPTTICSARNKT